MKPERIAEEFGDNVRVLWRDTPFDGDDIVVQVRKPRSVLWEDVRSFNSFSDDYAHSNARDYAIRLERSLIS